MKQSILLKFFINLKFISHLWNVYREIWFHTAATESSRYLIVWRKGKKKKLPNKLIILVFLFFLSPFLVSFIHLTDHLMLTRSMLRGLMPSHLTFTVPHTRSSSINVKLRRTRVLPIIASIRILFCKFNKINRSFFFKPRAALFHSSLENRIEYDYFRTNFQTMQKNSNLCIL